jgi:DNA-directed RNA polymerase omega subunit
MARITSEVAAEMAGNRYDLVIMAAQRARELKRGYRSKMQSDNGPIVTAIREIELGHIGREALKKNPPAK